MKNIFLLLIISLFFSVAKANSNFDLFAYNQEQINTALSFDESSNFGSKISLQFVSPSQNEEKTVAFAWGFCCWPVGIFTVVNKAGVNSDELKSFHNGWFLGCVVGTIASYAAFFYIGLNGI